jgi:hypothetical protein
MDTKIKKKYNEYPLDTPNIDAHILMPQLRRSYRTDKPEVEQFLTIKKWQ